MQPLDAFARTLVLKPLLRSLLLVLLALLLSAPALADDTDGMIERALKASGMAAQLEHLSQGILSAVPEDAFPDKKTRAAAAAFLKEDAPTQVLVSAVHAAMRESLDTDALDKALNFLDSSVGKKVGRAQQAAIEASALKRVREGRSLLSSLTDSRTALLQRIITAQHVPEGNGQLLNAVVRGLADGSLTGTALDFQPEEVTRKIKLIAKEINANRESTEETALLSSAHVFRSLDDKELEELASFEESEPAARFRTALNLGLGRAVYQCAKALGTYFAKPQPEPQHKPQRAPGERPRSRDRATDDSPSWDLDSRDTAEQ
jgi:hypothetical protein